jgi:glucose-6-phosphate isomerase
MCANPLAPPPLSTNTVFAGAHVADTCAANGAAHSANKVTKRNGPNTAGILNGGNATYYRLNVRHSPTPNPVTLSARPDLADTYAATLTRWERDGSTARLWDRDARLWTGRDEAAWLGWLDLTDLDGAALETVRAAVATLRTESVDEILLLGMGGSSLGAEVMARVLPRGAAGLPIRVVDSLIPSAVHATLDAADWSRTGVVVASKSGGTLEPAVLLALALERLERAHGATAARRVLAVTDPGSALEQEAAERRFAATVLGRPAVGGRFSALSPFGLVPAVLLDAPIATLRAQALAMAERCRVHGADNPGVALGVAMAVAAQAGRDKCTVLLPPSLAPMGVWIEQLVAESTGKHGHMILPIVDEPSGAALEYGDDRLFVHVVDASEHDPHASLVAALRDAGAPVFTVTTSGATALWAEFFRWEFATAVAGAVLGVHPFDQPDVEASKIETRALSSLWEREGVPTGDGDVAHWGSDESAAALARWSAECTPGDYGAILAWLPMTPDIEAAMSQVRIAVRRRTGVATTIGFGPRYLHSSGQAFKGGPNTGCFLSLTADEAHDRAVPGRTLSLGAIARAQREGELAVLRARGRRVLELHLGADPVRAILDIAHRIAEDD